MKKTYILGLMAAVLGFTACSSDDDATLPENKQEGMVLKATVSQAKVTRATIDDAADTWLFDFSLGDIIAVNNDHGYGYSSVDFTKGANNFTSTSARPESTPATWYAYFPGLQVFFTNQTGRKEDVANRYALLGATTEPTTGEDGLSIDMQPQVAILVIDNQRGSIDINVKNGPDSWVAGLNAVGTLGVFNIMPSDQKLSILTTTARGTYYIAVPAGVQLSIKNGNKVLKSTGVNGLTAGKYYNLTIEALDGYADTKSRQVKWTQLWENGPKWAEYNVGANSVTEYGGYYSWGGKENKNTNDYNTGTETLSGEYDTATRLWGSNWRMPTIEELRDLRDNCDSEWTNVDGVYGFKFTGKTEPYTSKSVFFPAAGYVLWDSIIPRSDGESSFYWSSNPSGTDVACNIWLVNGLGNNGYYNEENSGRSHCFSVRAVLNEN